MKVFSLRFTHTALVFVTAMAVLLSVSLFAPSAQAHSPEVPTCSFDSGIDALEGCISEFLAIFEHLNSPHPHSPVTNPPSTSLQPWCSYDWSRTLYFGLVGEDVRILQKFLNSLPGIQVAESGPGAPGNETMYFGLATSQAVVQFQERYAEEILHPLGLTQGTGVFGRSSWAQVKRLCDADSSPNDPPNGNPAGSSLSVSPTSGEAPLNVEFKVTADLGKEVVLKFGDESANVRLTGTGEAIRVSHTYTNRGTYQAVLEPYVSCAHDNPLVRCEIGIVPLGKATVTVGGGTSYPPPPYSQASYYSQGWYGVSSDNFSVGDTVKTTSGLTPVYSVLAFGTRVTWIGANEEGTVVEGPKDYNGTVWWKVTFDAVTGWVPREKIQVVESAGNNPPQYSQASYYSQSSYVVGDPGRIDSFEVKVRNTANPTGRGVAFGVDAQDMCEYRIDWGDGGGNDNLPWTNDNACIDHWNFTADPPYLVGQTYNYNTNGTYTVTIKVRHRNGSVSTASDSVVIGGDNSPSGDISIGDTVKTTGHTTWYNTSSFNDPIGSILITYGTVVEGPVEADEGIWWRVQVGPKFGWLLESAIEKVGGGSGGPGGSVAIVPGSIRVQHRGGDALSVTANYNATDVCKVEESIYSRSGGARRVPVEREYDPCLPTLSKELSGTVYTGNGNSPVWINMIVTVTDSDGAQHSDHELHYYEPVGW